MNFFRPFDNRRAHREIDEELQFHLELLTEEHCRQNLSWDQARTEALKRFGNLEQTRNECIKIARRNQPAILALKWLFGFVFVIGVLVRVFGADYHVTRVGDILMEIGVLGRLLVYLRGLTPPRHLTGDDSTPLKLNESELSLSAYDESWRTPVERVVSSK